MMIRYVATKDSYSKQCRLYRKGQIYEFEGEPETPYFTRLDGSANVPEPAREVPPVPPIETPAAMIESGEPVPMSLAAMTNSELRKVAETRNLKVPVKATKDELIRLIVDAEESLK